MATLNTSPVSNWCVYSMLHAIAFSHASFILNSFVYACPTLADLWAERDGRKNYIESRILVRVTTRNERKDCYYRL